MLCGTVTAPSHHGHSTGTAPSPHMAQQTWPPRRAGNITRRVWGSTELGEKKKKQHSEHVKCVRNGPTPCMPKLQGHASCKVACLGRGRQHGVGVAGRHRGWVLVVLQSRCVASEVHPPISVRGGDCERHPCRGAAELTLPVSRLEKTEHLPPPKQQQQQQ